MPFRHMKNMVFSRVHGLLYGEYSAAIRSAREDMIRYHKGDRKK